MDLVVQVPTSPDRARRCMAGACPVSGGKGANQAVAASAWGIRHSGGSGGSRRVWRRVAGHAGRGGVATAGVRRVPDASTGVALISVASDGQNAIVVAPVPTWLEPGRRGRRGAGGGRLPTACSEFGGAAASLRGLSARPSGAAPGHLEPGAVPQRDEACFGEVPLRPQPGGGGLLRGVHRMR